MCTSLLCHPCCTSAAGPRPRPGLDGLCQIRVVAKLPRTTELPVRLGGGSAAAE